MQLRSQLQLKYETYLNNQQDDKTLLCVVQLAKKTHAECHAVICFSYYYTRQFIYIAPYVLKVFQGRV